MKNKPKKKHFKLPLKNGSLMMLLILSCSACVQQCTSSIPFITFKVVCCILLC